VKQILHLYADTPEFARFMLQAALQSGFRESGAMNIPNKSLGSSPIMLAIRTNGLSFDSVVGYADEEGALLSIVDSAYIFNMLSIANERFTANKERTQRFQKAVSCIPRILAPSRKEDAETRKQRKRAEGLARQQALSTTGLTVASAAHSTDLDLASDAIF